jgi:hypothetical protein
MKGPGAIRGLSSNDARIAILRVAYLAGFVDFLMRQPDVGRGLLRPTAMLIQKPAFCRGRRSKGSPSPNFAIV